MGLTLVTIFGSPSAVAAEPAASVTGREWTILAHLDARGGLGAAAASYERQLKSAAVRGRLGLVIQAYSEGSQEVRRGALRGSTLTMRPVPVPAEGVGPLGEFVSWGTRAAPARHYALLVMGHGAGLLHGGTLPEGAVQSRSLKAGLEQACRGLGQRLDVVALDTCYGATLEVAYDLRGVSRYLTGAPGVIYSPGLDWAGALADLAVRPQAETLVRALVRRGMPGCREAVALVGLDLEQIEPVSAQALRLSRALQTNLAQEQSLLTYVRARCPSWGERDELADVGALASGLAGTAITEDTRAAARDLQTGLQRLVVTSWRSGPSAEGTGNSLGLYFPPTLEPVPSDYATEFAFASAAGWAELLSSYWTRLAGMIKDGVAP